MPYPSQTWWPSFSTRLRAHWSHASWGFNSSSSNHPYLMFLSSLQANIFYYIINVFHNKYSNADTVVILNIKTKYTHLLDYIISYKDVNIQVKLSEDIISTCISIVYKGMSQPQFLIKKKKLFTLFILNMYPQEIPDKMCFMWMNIHVKGYTQETDNKDTEIYSS